MSDGKLVIKMRQAMEPDIPFIFNSWLRSFRENGLAHTVTNEVYFAEQHKLIEKLLKRSTTTIVCNPSDPGQIFGWACYEHIDGIFVLHYVYVKNPYRQLGLANELLAETKHNFAEAGLFTHRTRAAMRNYMQKNLIYHPYILVNYPKT